MIVGYLRRMVSVAAVKAQCRSLLGRLEAMGPETAQARNRRMQAMELERGWRRDRQAHILSEKQGQRVVRRGFAKLD